MKSYGEAKKRLGEEVAIYLGHVSRFWLQGRTCWSGGVAGLFIEVAIEGVNGGAIVQGENVYGDSSVVFGACAFC